MLRFQVPQGAEQSFEEAWMAERAGAFDKLQSEKGFRFGTLLRRDKEAPSPSAERLPIRPSKRDHTLSNCSRTRGSDCGAISPRFAQLIPIRFLCKSVRVSGIFVDVDPCDMSISS